MNDPVFAGRTSLINDLVLARRTVKQNERCLAKYRGYGAKHKMNCMIRGQEMSVESYSPTAQLKALRWILRNEKG
jgi:hypothetical protein